MSGEKWKSIERSLAEQQSFVQSIIEQREKKARVDSVAPVDNILTSSIRKAKQKIQQIDIKIQSGRQDQSLEKLRQKKQKVSNQQNSCIAGAIKKLQERINNLEQQNKKIENEYKELNKKNMLQIEKYQALNQNYHSNIGKINNLQSIIQKNKKIIKELQKKCQNYQQQLQNQHLSNNCEELQHKLSACQLMHKNQEQELRNAITDNQNKERTIMEMENKQTQLSIRYTEEINVIKSINKQLELRVAGLEQSNRQKQLLIEGFRKQLKSSERQSSPILKHSAVNVNNFRNDQLSNKTGFQNSQTRYTKKKHFANNNELQQLKQKYKQLLQMYKNIDNKNRQQREEIKYYKNILSKLKQHVKQLIQKIQQLPKNITHQFKILIVKINKMKLFTNDYFLSSQLKYNMKTSLVRSSSSRSRSRTKSNSKNKRHEDLNCSNNSIKSKKSTHSNRSVKSNRSKQKYVIISQKTIKKSEICELQSQIQDIRKKYKELVVSQNKNDDVSEDLREQLNNLALLLQEKSEELTKLKRKK